MNTYMNDVINIFYIHYILFFRPEHVGDAMVKLIEKGKNEAVWVCKDGKQPYAVEFSPLKKIELQL